MNNPIQSLWIGGDLSNLERISIQSFLDYGHQYHLYAYQDIANVPAGAVLKDANEIFPASRIFQYSDHKTYAAFSNVFRYKLLLERGGIWADTDVVSLRPFDLANDHVFASEIVQRNGGPSEVVLGTCVIKAPIGSPAMALALQICLSKDWSAVRWSEIGPRLLAEVVAGQGLQRFIQRPALFCSVHPRGWLRLIEAQPPSLPADAYALHFWNELWRRAGQDKNAEYPPSCLNERLKLRHLYRTDRDSVAATAHGLGSPDDIDG